MTLALTGLSSLFLALACTSAAFAQVSTGGNIRGYVIDEHGGVLPGATVSATSAAVPGVWTATSDAGGLYRLLDLPPGEYTIAAELRGFARFSRSGLAVMAGLNIAMDVSMTVGSLTETIVVSGEAPMLEVQKPVQGVNISGALQRALPLGSRRDFSDFLEVTPGVTARTFDQGTGGQVYMLRGSEIDNHVVQIDGADVGSFRQGWAGLYMGLSTDAIDDTQIKTGSVDAATPLGVGVVVNIVTPSGTDRIKGSASTIYEARSWNGSNAAAGGRSAYVKVFQPDLSLGGPIVKDKLFFFGSFRYADREIGISRTTSQLTALSTLDPSFTVFPNGGRNTYYYVKVTAQWSPNRQAYLFWQRDFNPEVAAFPTDARAFRMSAFGGNAFGARVSSVLGSSVTTRLLAAYNDKSLNGTFDAFEGHTFAGPERDIYDSSFVSGGVRRGSGFLGQYNNALSVTATPTSKLTLQADLTYFASDWGGSHEFQAGVFAQPRLSNEDRVRYANGGAALEELTLREPGNLSSGTVVFRRQVFDAPTIVSASRLARDFAIFVQDAWKPLAHLTVSAGLRVDKILVKDRVYDRDVQDSLEIGPRFGATYVLTADQNNVIRASYGRVADLPQPAYLPSAGGNPVGSTDYYDNNLDGIFETVIRNPPITPQNSDRRVDPKRHQPFIDEWTLGYRRQLPGQVTADASVIRRYYKSRPALVEINRIVDGVTFKGYMNEALNDIFFVTNNTWNTQVYSGLEFVVAKRTSRLNLIAGYTRGFQHLDGTWTPGDPASFIQPDAFPNNRGIGTIRGFETNSLSGTGDTRSPSWQKHAFRGGIAYNGPWDTVVASTLVALSGPYSGPIVTRIAAADPQFGPSTVRLSNGRQVSNPLATTIRFAFPTRGEGQLKAPTLIVWNLRVGREFRVGAGRLSVAADVFNVTNRRADQQFQTGGNQLYNTTNYGIGPDGSFRGQTRQAPRSAQLSVRYTF